MYRSVKNSSLLLNSSKLETDMLDTDTSTAEQMKTNVNVSKPVRSLKDSSALISSFYRSSSTSSSMGSAGPKASEAAQSRESLSTESSALEQGESLLLKNLK